VACGVERTFDEVEVWLLIAGEDNASVDAAEIHTKLGNQTQAPLWGARGEISTVLIPDPPLLARCWIRQARQDNILAFCSPEPTIKYVTITTSCSHNCRRSRRLALVAYRQLCSSINNSGV
jgi:hypothetical protein